MNLDFQFQAWEVSSSKVVNAPFLVELDGREFLLLAADSFARFCETSSPRHKSQPNEWNFAVGEALKVSSNTQVNPKFMRSLFQDEWRKGKYGRIVFFQKDLVFLGNDGCGFLRGASSPWSSGRSTAFHFDLADKFDALRASFWPAQLEEWNADEQSDFHFARDLAHSNENGAARLVTDINDGWLEMERVAHLLLQIDSNWQNAKYAEFYVFGVHVGIKRHETSTLSLVCAEYEWEDMELYRYDEAFHQPGELWNVWLRYFVRGFDEELLARHLVGESIQSCNFVLSCERRERTAHEQLETRLQLRDWLQDKLLPEQVAALLF